MLKIKNEWFVDDKGRLVLLRGVNIGSTNKIPGKPNESTHIKTDFSEHLNVSFVNRPFPVKEADKHFKRLKHWGFNCIRFLMTWEAIEHGAPNKYDKEYIDYIAEIFKIAESNGLYMFIDPHQDVWSRMSGGDGAPCWLFEKVGLDYTKFDESEAAYVMQHRYDPNKPRDYLPMYWVGNEHRLACSTMVTLFFGGKDFAPSCNIDSQNAQDYLQEHYCNAFRQVAAQLKDAPNLLGFGTYNEPNSGFIGKMLDGSNMTGFKEILGHAFVPFDAMAISSGYPRDIGFHEIKRFGIKTTSTDTLNPNRISAWLDGKECIWKKEGIWGVDENKSPKILRNDYFVNRNGNLIDFSKEYISPFIAKFAQTIRTAMPNAIIFFEGKSEDIIRGKDVNFDVPENSVNTSHWYDFATIGTKRAMLKANFDTVEDKPIVGKKNVQNMFARQLSNIKGISKRIRDGIPTVIGEFGLAYDIGKKDAYEISKTDPETAWQTHVKALTMYYNAMDANLLNCLQWNYTPDNTNEWGDHWNLEDLSIFSRDQQYDPNDINSGGRAIHGFCRPHYIQCAGIPLKMEFNIKTGEFSFEFDGDASIQAPTTIYIPRIQYPNGFDIKATRGNIELKEVEQLVLITLKENGNHTITITKKE